jgi:hypothetical protein
MLSYKTQLEQADMIFLNAPSINKLFFLSEGKSLTHMKDKVRNISFSMKKANFTEIKVAVDILTAMKL